MLIWRSDTNDAVRFYVHILVESMKVYLFWLTIFKSVLFLVPNGSFEKNIRYSVLVVCAYSEGSLLEGFGMKGDASSKTMLWLLGTANFLKNMETPDENFHGWWMVVE